MTTFDLKRFRNLPENKELAPLEFFEAIRKAADLFRGAAQAIDILLENEKLEAECGYCDECEACEEHYFETVQALVEGDQKVFYELLAHARIESIVRESRTEKETKS